LARCSSRLWAADGVSYIDEEGQSKTADGVTAVTSGSVALGTPDNTTWYSVSGDVTVSDRIIVTGDVRLILARGA
jgi:hypothetical protein